MRLRRQSEVHHRPAQLSCSRGNENQRCCECDGENRGECPGHGSDPGRYATRVGGYWRWHEIGRGHAALHFFNSDAGVANGLKPLPHVLAQTPLDQIANARRNGLRESAPLGIVSYDGGKRLRNGLPTKCALARQHLIEQTTERPNVGTAIDGLALGLFGRHVGGGA